MGLLLEIVVSVFVLGMLYIVFMELKNTRRVNEYLSLYKIGRIMQIAKDKGIDLVKVKQSFTSKQTFEDAIESKLLEDIALEDVEENTKPKTQTTTKRTHNKKKKK